MHIASMMYAVCQVYATYQLYNYGMICTMVGMCMLAPGSCALCVQVQADGRQVGVRVPDERLAYVLACET